MAKKKTYKKFRNVFDVDGQLCWMCAKACGGCAWSDNLTPVKGWDAKMVPYKKQGVQEVTWQIYDCPEFERG